jgi:N-acetylglucosaminylphosphatidylinositol deacetylase
MDTSSPSSSSLYILVIAHPDDECMFFLPTLLHFRSVMGSAQVWVVCLSNGNYEGKGSLREMELKTACRIVGVHKCFCVNVLPDDPRATWPATTISRALDAVLLETLQQDDHFSSLTLLTFDQGGVSGHSNHVDTYRGVQYWLSHHHDHTNTTTFQNKLVTGWKLATVSNILVKYIPILWLPCRLYFHLFTPAGWCLYWTSSIRLVWRAMAAHSSQFVWYRRLSVVFSQYSYSNAWSEIQILKEE